MDNRQLDRIIMEEIGNATGGPTDRYGEWGLELLIGIPGCGKSTYLRRIDDPNVVVVCPDDIRREMTGDVSDQSRNRDVWLTAEDMMMYWIDNGRYVILDATNVGTRNRVDLVRRMRREFGDNLPVYATVFGCDPEISKERIQRDIQNGVDRANVPPDIIDRMYSQYLETLESIYDEEFDGVFFADNK